MESIEAAEEDAGSVEEEDEEGQAEEEAEEEDETDIGCIRGALEPVDCGFSCESKGACIVEVESDVSIVPPPEAAAAAVVSSGLEGLGDEGKRAEGDNAC